jgi:hypothetical protein
MANTFNIRNPKNPTVAAHLVRIRKEISRRVEGCFEPRCWTLKSDADTGRIYVDKSLNAGGRGRYVQIRRLLFLLAFDEVPDRRQVNTRCDTERCQNPAHAKVRDWPITSQEVSKMVELNWLTKEQAHEWYHWG